ncbi:Protein of unknown function [Gryllus bimaculatus]|nr:Protein of unknown function [Gryllus bimaculatus]
MRTSCPRSTPPPPPPPPPARSSTRKPQPTTTNSRRTQRRRSRTRRCDTQTGPRRNPLARRRPRLEARADSPINM